MKVSIYLADQNPHRDRTLGITNMTHDLLSEFAKRDNIELSTVVSKSSYRLLQAGRNENILPWRTDTLPGRLVSDNLHPKLVHSKSDLWFYPKGYLPFFDKPKKPVVGMVHDTILLWYYDYYKHERSALDYLYWLNLMKRSIARFDLILTISEHAKAQILNLCSRFNINPPPIKVTYESVRYIGEPFVSNKGEYVLHLASRVPHKKTKWLVDVWLDLASKGFDLPVLKMVGSVPAGMDNVINKNPLIEKIPRLSDAEFKETLARARVLIVPSEIEGFGLPALEAYCLGTPACYVKGTAVDEVLSSKDGIGGFDLNSSESLVSALEKTLEMPVSDIMDMKHEIEAKYSISRFADRVLSHMSDLMK